ncbi:hypothetical protein BGZ83_006640 [Gryganskiella cystojenkinii]|nr:hypothetical protein BGZ83_006640 [Gryganskiella cystojenkinii]
MPILATTTAMTVALSVPLVENRLTSLDILVGDAIPGRYLGESRARCLGESRAPVQRDRLIRRFLCTSPLLVHFRCDGRRSLSLDVFQDYDQGMAVRSPCPPLWACRGLKTLSFSLDPGKNSRTISYLNNDQNSQYSRFVFGYLSRVCPLLESLSIWFRGIRVFKLESGLCLLTRLRYLDRLAIYSDLEKSEDFFDGFDCPRSPVVWIQGCDDHPSVLKRYRESLDATQQFSLWSPSFSDPSFTTGTSLTQVQQQVDNKYESDYDRSMVDGLADLKLCGSTLDIEALLQARMHQFEVERESKQGYGQHVQDSDRHHRPWPVLKRLVLSYALCRPTEARQIIQKLFGQTQQILEEMRPDIEFHCQASSGPDFCLNMLASAAKIPTTAEFSGLSSGLRIDSSGTYPVARALFQHRDDPLRLFQEEDLSYPAGAVPKLALLGNRPSVIGSELGDRRGDDKDDGDDSKRAKGRESTGSLGLILGDPSNVYYHRSKTVDTTQDWILHALLCSSPNLVLLKASQTVRSRFR